MRNNSRVQIIFISEYNVLVQIRAEFIFRIFLKNIDIKHLFMKNFDIALIF